MSKGIENDSCQFRRRITVNPCLAPVDMQFVLLHAVIRSNSRPQSATSRLSQRWRAARRTACRDLPGLACRESRSSRAGLDLLEPVAELAFLFHQVEVGLKTEEEALVQSEVPR